MNIRQSVNEINNIDIGFDALLAEQKLEKINSLLTELESKTFIEVCKISREDIISVLRLAYGISYEIGNTKNYLQSKTLVETGKRILAMARLLFGKQKDLLPYLTLNLHYSIGSKELHDLIEKEISEIENTL